MKRRQKLMADERREQIQRCFRNGSGEPMP
jgi:hypothetical protein